MPAAFAIRTTLAETLWLVAHDLEQQLPTLVRYYCEQSPGARAMNGLKDVTGTAFIVAEFRVRENAEAHPLYVDPIAPIFLDERTKQAADAITAGFPPAEKMVRLRTCYLDSLPTLSVAPPHHDGHRRC
jgi:hypothetical protein